MPRIRQAAVDATFYLFRRNPKTGKIDGPWGTGFFVIRSSKLPSGYPHLYAVTNWHVAVDSGASIIRVNTHDGKSRPIEYDPGEWTYPQDGDDLAIIDVTEKLDPGNDQMIGLYEDMFVTEKEFETFSIGLGEDTFMCGLFASHHGGDRNVPVVRFGNLSMLANSAAPVELETGAKLPCHLVDTRSRSGFSGSPVFIFRGIASDLGYIPYGWERKHIKGGIDSPYLAELTRPETTFWGLLGIHCGQFWDPIEVRKARTKERLGDPIAEGDTLEVQSGMTIVIPAARILRLLESEDLEMARQRRDDEGFTAAQRRPRAEIAAPDDSGPSEPSANPNHLEDFKRLVDVAARKRPQGD
jgi:hypothetical protein